MSLEGSLQTVALPEVLHLLADTAKSGELRVHGGPAAGRLWFDAGELSGFEAGRCDRAVDALFDLLRIDAGEFVFDAEATQPDDARRPGSPDGESPEHATPAARVDIRPVLEEAEAKLVEWHDIVAVIPSLGHEVYLVEDAPEAGVVLEPAQWSLVVAIGEGRTVQEVLEQLSLPEFDGCKTLKGLVDAVLVEVVEPEEVPEAVESVDDALADDSAAPARAGVDDDHSANGAREALSALLEGISPANGADGLSDRGPWTSHELASLDHAEAWHGAEAEQPSGQQAQVAPSGDAGPAGADGHADDEPTDPDHEGSEPINRGLLLKFLSSVRS